MKTIIAATALAAFATAPLALAETGMGFSDIDANGDGALTLAEIQAVNPDVTEAKLSAYDTNGDMQLSQAEFDAWKAEKTAGDKGEDDAMSSGDDRY